MKKYILFTLKIFVLLGSIPAIAQSYPAFNVDVCSSGSSGYYFIVPIKIGTNLPDYQMILDSLGRVVYYKTFPQGSGDFKIQPNGLMSYSKGSKFFLEDSSFTVVDSVQCLNNISTDVHDLQILPNGHFLLLGTEIVVMDLSSYHFFGSSHTFPGNMNANVKCGVIQEQDANHNVVFEWHTKDHFAFGDVDYLFLGSPLNVDWTHCNSVGLDTDGNILLSTRHFDEITKIDRSDSSIIWHLGGNANQFTFTNDSAMFIGQHDARRIANGHLTLNDNGRANVHYASAKEYQLDENLHTATLVWNYVEDSASYSMAIGDVQRLANGNTVVDNGWTPLKNHMFNVVDPSGNKVFQVTFQDTLRTYRAFNYPVLPWSLIRPQISCYSVSSQLYLDAGSGYSSYLWSNGATTQAIAVSAADTFSVFVADGHGGFISSDYIVVNDPSTYCSSSAVEEIPGSGSFSISPDPVSDELNIRVSHVGKENVNVKIFDLAGKCVCAKEFDSPTGEFMIPVNDLPSGIYFILVNGTAKKFIRN